MRILFDQGTPVPLRDHLPGHIIETAFELGWSTLENGILLAAAEDSFDLLITTDQKLRYQQNLVGRKLPRFLLLSTAPAPANYLRLLFKSALARDRCLSSPQSSF
jgi:predicted nuclease of predicted toxin-antitoxin system